ncbi:MAG: hypothetical protein MUO24_05690 [Desulfobacterales bacterium]|nr:hypothetical protein [Desulfobacterales bacterium]
MLETITMIVLLSVGAITGASILGYAIYTTFYPFAKTVGGVVEVLKHYGKQRTPAKADQRDYVLTPDRRLGFTMADGGKKIRQRKKTTK